MSDQLRFVTLDVFTTKRYQGNPLGVVFLPDPATRVLSQAQKQTIAQEYNLSETIFVHTNGPNDTTRTIDIFTTDSELPFAGHPTIGATSWFLCHAPSTTARVEKLLMKAGEVPISRQPQAQAPDAVAAEIAHDVHIHSKGFPLRELLGMFTSLEPFFVTAGADATLPVFSIVKGMSQILVELPSLEALAAVTTASGGEVSAEKADLDGPWRTGLVCVYFFVRGVEDESLGGRKTIRTRMILGNLEDPATGSAASGLGAYLSLVEGRQGRFEYDFVQGVEMGRRSDIGLAVEVKADGKIKTVELKGSAVKISEGLIVIPEE